MPATRNGLPMKREELTELVRRNNADTLIAQRFREALHLPHAHKSGHTRDKSRKARRYRGAKKLMAQKYGVKL